MSLLFLVLLVWVGVSAGATLVMCGVCTAGRVQDEALGYVPVGTATVPAPRAAADDLARV